MIPLYVFGKGKRHRGGGKSKVIFALIRGTQYVAEWKVFRFHFAQFKWLSGFGPFPTLFLPSSRFGRGKVHWTGEKMATESLLRNWY
jgi:hypothetical protein